MEQAEYARDMKREGGMCRWGLCTRSPSTTITVNGRSFGVCPKHDRVATETDDEDIPIFV